MSKPKRIQLKRTKGWRKPEGAVVVSRPSKWGNPFKVGEMTHLWHRSGAWPYDFYRDVFQVVDRRHAVALFRSVLTEPEIWQDQPLVGHGWQHELRGRDLACWCPLDQPCHADVLLEVAND